MSKGIPFPPGFTRDNVPPPALVRDAIAEEAELVPVKLPRRIGVMFADLQDVNVPALKYLIVQLNCVQTWFEFELLKCKEDDTFVANLSDDHALDRKEVRANSAEFVKTFRIYLEDLIRQMKVRETPPDYFMLVTLAKFADEFYAMWNRNSRFLPWETGSA